MSTNDHPSAMWTAASAPFRGRVVLITGASGFIGGNLVRALREAGAALHAASLPDQPPAAQDGVTAHEIDLRDAVAVRRLIADLSPAVVFHLAGVVDTGRSPDRIETTLQGNLVSSVNVMEASVGKGVERVVITGSSEELTVATGEAPTPYAASKAALSPYLALFRSTCGLDVAAVRPFMVYGAGQQAYRLIPSAVLGMLAGEHLVIRDPRRVIDLVHVDDVVAGLLVAGGHPEPLMGVYDLGTGTGSTIGSAIEHIRELIPDAPSAVFEDRPASTAPHIAFEHGERLPGWRADTALHDGLRRTVEWYRAHGSVTLEES